MLFIGSTIDIGGIFGSSEYVNIFWGKNLLTCSDMYRPSQWAKNGKIVVAGLPQMLTKINDFRKIFFIPQAPLGPLPSINIFKKAR